MAASVSEAYKDQFELCFRKITARAFCYRIHKHFHIFVQQCTKAGIPLEEYGLTICRKNSKKFESTDYVIGERNAVVFLLAFEPAYKERIVKLMQEKPFEEIKLAEVLGVKR